jgi:choloylglycine hydrolase
MPLVADGLNEKELACGAFYFPGWADYEQPSKFSTAVISNLDLVSWALGNYATVDELLEALKTTQVIGFIYKPWGIIPPLHYIVVDSTGHQAILEYVKGHLNVYETTIGTITNSPPYDWHLVNARNYIGLQALNRPAVKIEGKELAAFGQGSGSIGLPGDFTPLLDSFVLHF